MEHPFFDSVAYPWNRSDAQQLHRLLQLAVQDPGTIDLIYKQCAPLPPALTTPANAELLWKEAFDNLAKLGALQALVTQLKQRFAGNPQIANALQAIEQAKSALETKVVSPDLFVLDCNDQREAVGRMISQTMAKTLLVRGLPRSGKTHCKYILQAVAREKGVDVVYMSDATVSTVDEVIDNLFSSLGASDQVPPKVNTDDAWYRSVCTKLKAAAGDKKLWVVIDDLGYNNGDPNQGPLLDTKIRVFFEQFALFMTDPSFASKFRLMLINYSEPILPAKWKTEMWTETRTDENTIQGAHIEEFLKDWSQFTGIEIIEQDRKRLAGQVISEAAAPATDAINLSRLERINAILNTKLANIKQAS